MADRSLLGLASLLDVLPKVEIGQRRTKAKLLWEELAHLEERRGKGVYTGEYTWTHYGSYQSTFDAAFVRILNTIDWVPDQDGNLRRPGLVLFDSLGWKQNPFLLSTIRFKPPIIETLAKEVGIEPGLLDLLKKLGLTSESQLRERLGIEDRTDADVVGGPSNVNDAIDNLLQGAPPPTRPVDDPSGVAPIGPGSGGTKSGSGAGAGGTPTGKRIGGARTPGTDGGRPFISYVAVGQDNEDTDPVGLDQHARMAIEETAIAFILATEPNLRRTTKHNPGFDLFEIGEDDQPRRWVEVKGMSGGLKDHPVGISRAQFDCARERGDAFWLYVVEHANDPETTRVIRIRNPAGKARTFTFDQGWTSVDEAIEGAEPAQ